MTTVTQGSFDDIGEPLSSTTFVVVDLETTGASAGSCQITEIGAVKTRGGEVIGEFQTLVDPGVSIPPMIVALTGITDAMVIAAPRIEEVLPAFLEFLGDAVLVAHNAPFDTGFLKAACKTHGYVWPSPQVVDTVTLARRATTRDEVPNRKLSTLARLFGTEVTPNHRALEDARATGEILHRMLERLAAFGITHREDLEALRNPVPDSLRKKATMADAVPAKPGVYTFVGPQGERLYVGTSKNLRARVKSYFTRGETRRKIRDMLELAVTVETQVCATELEANVVEVRQIHQWRPRFNRRSARPERTPWVRLTDEPYPRLVVSKSDHGDPSAIGPMRSSSDAGLAVEALQSALGVRTCTARLPKNVNPGARACVLKDMGSCSAPCVRGEESGYRDTVEKTRDALFDDLSPVVSALESRIQEFVSDQQYERAASIRDSLGALVAGAARADRLASLRQCQLVAVRRDADAWELVSLSRGVLVGSARVTSGVWKAAAPLREAWSALPVDVASVEETELALRWLEREGTRLLYMEGAWVSPINGAARHRKWEDARKEDRSRTHEWARSRG